VSVIWFSLLSEGAAGGVSEGAPLPQIKKAIIIHDSVDYHYLVAAARRRDIATHTGENIAIRYYVINDKN